MNIDEFDAAFFSKDDVYGCVGLCKKQDQTLSFLVFSLKVTDNELLSIVRETAVFAGSEVTKINGRKLGTERPPPGPFSQKTRSYLHVPFAYASPLLYESLEQANLPNK